MEIRLSGKESVTPSGVTSQLKTGDGIAIAFGLLAKTSGIPNLVSCLMSALIYAGASQFFGVNLMSLGIMPWEIVMTTFVLNLRHFLMSASMTQRIHQSTPKSWRALLSFGVTDETFSVVF